METIYLALVQTGEEVADWLVTVLNFAFDLGYFSPLKERMSVKIKKVIYSEVMLSL